MMEDELKANTLDNSELKNNGTVGYSSIEIFLTRVKGKNPGEIDFFKPLGSH